MNTKWASLLLLVVKLIVSPEACFATPRQPADGPGNTGLLERFSRVGAGMSPAEVREILGPADQVLAATDDASNRIHVWRNGWLFFVHGTVLVKFENDRVAIASYSSGNIPDPVRWVADVDERLGGNRRPRDIGRLVGIPGALLSYEKPWADLSSILTQLDESWRSTPPIEPDVVSLFDSITAETDVESILETAGTPTDTREERTHLTHVWDLGSARMTVDFERGALTAKRLDTADVAIVVKASYWKAEDLRDGSAVTEYL